MSDRRTHVATECVSAHRVTGADIPEELFESILRHMDAPQWAKKDGLPPSRSSAVHSLASLNRVCKYFARICRPRLYGVVLLQNRRQLRALVNLLDNGCAPLGEHLLAFTHYLVVQSEEDDTPWVHHISLVLFPRMIHAGISIPEVSLTVDKTFAGLVPTRGRLPRTLPFSLFQHVCTLRVNNMQFRHEGDLFRYLSSFRSLGWVDLQACSCKTIANHTPAAPHTPQISRWKHFNMQDSSTIVPILIPDILDLYSRHRSVGFLTRGQAEAEVLVATTKTCYERLTPSTLRFCYVCECMRPSRMIWSILIILFPLVVCHDGRFLIHMGADSGSDSSGPKIHVSLCLRLHPNTTHYDFTFRTLRLPAHDGSIDATLILDVWRELADHISRLPHLNVLKFEFKSIEQMGSYVEIIHPVLLELQASGLTMKFRVNDSGFSPYEPSDWESASTILERFVCVVSTDSALSFG